MDGRHLVLLVEETDSSIGFYDSKSGQEVGRLELSLWPHEVTVSRDGRTAYVTNFGLRDYDLTLGYAGNSVSVIDIAARCEIHRLYTATRDFQYWAPHGVKLAPNGKHLYVNVERVVGLRGVDPSAGQGQEQTKILIYDIKSRRMVRSFNLPAVNMAERNLSLKSLRPNVFFGEPFDEQAVQSYGVPRGSHNFVFGTDGAMWIFSGPNGISRIDPKSGEITWQSRKGDFNGSVRGLALFSNGNLLVSATNEVSILDTKKLRILKKFRDLGVGQILYSQVTNDDLYILAPAPWEGQVLIISVKSGRIVKSLTTGVDPVHVIVPRNSKVAYVTHGRSHWAAEIDLKSFEITRRIFTRGGPNGVDVATWFPVPERRTLTLAALLPFTGQYSVEGREIRLGYELWRDKINAAGGIVIDGKPAFVDICFEDTGSSTDLESLFKQTVKLIKRTGARMLLGCYPAVTNWALARAVEKSGCLLVTCTADDVKLFEKGYKNVFGIMTPSNIAATALFEAIWRRISPKPETAVLLVNNDSSSLRRAHELALVAKKYNVRLLGLGRAKPRGDRFVIYASPEEVTAQLVQSLYDLTPDLLIHTGERKAAARLVKAGRQSRFIPGAIISTCGVTSSWFRTELGTLAAGVIGPVQWSASLENYGWDRFVSAQDYVRIYYGEHSEMPSYLAAGGTASGVVLETAIRQVQSEDIAKIRDELLKIDRPTFFGDITFDNRGLNTAKAMVVVQLKGSNPGSETILAPDAFATPGSKLVWPFPTL